MRAEGTIFLDPHPATEIRDPATGNETRTRSAVCFCTCSIRQQDGNRTPCSRAEGIIPAETISNDAMMRVIWRVMGSIPKNSLSMS